MKILYPTKYEELTNQLGKEEGEKEYRKFLRSFSLEKYILKYGEVEGKKKFEEAKEQRDRKIKRPMLEKLTDKYGEVEGKVRHEHWLSGVNQSESSFIKRYGEELGKEKYELFRQKSIKNFEIVHKGNLPKSELNTHVDYYIKRYGEVEGRKKYKERQQTSTLNNFINKYGEKIGTKKYNEVNQKKAITFENLSKKYGETEATNRINNWKISLSQHGNKKYYIEKYGEEWYKDLLKRSTGKGTSYSAEGVEFCKEIISFLPGDNEFEIYYGENEYIFYTELDFPKLILPDLLLKSPKLNIVFEFYGDYWHKNPKIYKEEDPTVKERWEFDKKRISILQDKFNCKVFVCWEDDYKNNRDNIFNNIKKFLKENGVI